MKPVVVAVSGSCGTRDSFNSRFNPGYKDFFTCELATNQTSVIALMSPPVEPDFTPLGEMSDYDLWNVRDDLTRGFLPLVAELKPTYLLLDFFADIHFGVLRLEDGRFVTDNRWKLRKTDWYVERKEAGAFTRLTIQDDTEEYLRLWRDAMDRFAAHLAEHCPDTTVIVHRGWNTDEVRVPDSAAPIPLRQHKPISPLDVPRANELWAVLDDYCLDSFGWESIDLRAERAPSYAEHPWGPFYVHYTPDYYHRFMAELHKIHLVRTGVDPDLFSRLRLVEDAARESGDRRLEIADDIREEQAQTVHRQRDRIAELEGLGLVRGAKFALGQRLRRARNRTKEKP